MPFCASRRTDAEPRVSHEDMAILNRNADQKDAHSFPDRWDAQESFDAPIVLRKAVLPAAPIGGTLPFVLTATPGCVTVEILNHLASFLNEP